MQTIYWLSSPSDNEFDLTAAIAKHPELQLNLYILTDKQDKNHEYHMSMLTRASNIVINEIGGANVPEVLHQIAKINPDLIILRHPTWIPNDGTAKEYAEILQNTRYCATTWEWVPNYAMAQMPPLAGFKRIAVTNSQDRNRAKLSYPDKQILYLPFGVVDRTPEELAPMEQYSTDLICDAQPHYECKEYNAGKRYSVDQMIKPAIELAKDCHYKLDLWGSRYGNTTICDWASTPEFQPFHRGHFPTMEYPHVYASAKIYLGVTWNYATGGFSVRLARALSTGIMTIWQKTAGGDEDIGTLDCFECTCPSRILVWSENYEHTKDLIKYYMTHDRERIAMGQRGKAWALENWSWDKLLKRMIAEVQ
jgi:hypothetical protein